MKMVEKLAFEQCLKELNPLLSIALESLYIAGHQQLVSQVSDKLHKLNTVFKELSDREEKGE